MTNNSARFETLQPFCLLFFALACETIFIKMHSTENRCAIGLKISCFENRCAIGLKISCFENRCAIGLKTSCFENICAIGLKTSCFENRCAIGLKTSCFENRCAIGLKTSCFENRCAIGLKISCFENRCAIGLKISCFAGESEHLSALEMLQAGAEKGLTGVLCKRHHHNDQYHCICNSPSLPEQAYKKGLINLRGAFLNIGVKRLLWNPVEKKTKSSTYKLPVSFVHPVRVSSTLRKACEWKSVHIHTKKISFYNLDVEISTSVGILWEKWNGGRKKKRIYFTLDSLVWCQHPTPCYANPGLQQSQNCLEKPQNPDPTASYVAHQSHCKVHNPWTPMHPRWFEPYGYESVPRTPLLPRCPLKPTATYATVNPTAT